VCVCVCVCVRVFSHSTLRDTLSHGRCFRSASADLLRAQQHLNGFDTELVCSLPRSHVCVFVCVCVCVCV